MQTERNPFAGSLSGNPACADRMVFASGLSAIGAELGYAVPTPRPR